VSPGLWLLLLLLAGGGLFLLPFVPGLLEIRQRRDASALAVHNDARVDIQHFARRFSEFVHGHLEAELRTCQETGDLVQGHVNGGEPFLVLPETDAFLESPDERRAGRTSRLIVAAGDLHLPDHLVFERELYAHKSAHGGVGSRYRALYAEEDVELGEQSIILRWVHAGRALDVGFNCSMFGRASANASIFIHGACAFERMRAPVIELGPREFDEGWREGREELREIDPESLPGFKDRTHRRILIDGDLTLPERSFLDCELVVWGDVHVGKGSRCTGSVKSHGNLVLADGVQIDGSLVSQRGMEIGSGCRVHGPVLAERHLRALGRCQFGRALRPTTIRAESIRLHMGSVVHGTVWATSEGSVLP